MNFHLKMCRVCESTIKLTNIFGDNGKFITNKLESCADVTVSPDDNLPNYICSNCLDRLEAAYNFKMLCEQTDRKFRKGDPRIEIKVEQPLDVDESEESCNFMVKIHEDRLIEPIRKNRNENEVTLQQTIKRLSRRTERIKSGGVSESPKLIKCTKCSKRLPTEYGLQYHIRNMHNGPYSCKFCDKTFKSWHRLRRHRPVHPIQIQFECYQCHVTVEHILALKNHMRQKHSFGFPTAQYSLPKQKYNCHKCLAQFFNRNSLLKHLDAIHNIGSGKLVCTVCQQTFSWTENLRNHMKIHSDNRPQFNCTKCPLIFISLTALTRHKQEHLDDGQKQSTEPISGRPDDIEPDNGCKCPQCGVIYSSMYHVTRHIKRFHERGSRLECKTCGKIFPTPSTLRQHEIAHIEVRTFSCKLCTAKYKRKTTLTEHMKNKHDS